MQHNGSVQQAPPHLSLLPLYMTVYKKDYCVKLSMHTISKYIYTTTDEPLYNTIFGVQANFRVSYPNRVITRVKYTAYI